MKIDLHSHSTASDGSLSPKELVQHFHQLGIGCMALTDHDTFSGFEEAYQAAQSLNMRLISGCEFSCLWAGRTIHLVALDFDVHHPAVLQGVQRHLAARWERAGAIAHKLTKLGLTEARGFVDSLSAKPGAFAPGRAHFAQFLVDQGIVKNTNAAFKRYLTARTPAYVAPHWAELAQVTQWIKQAGGQAVIAHPEVYGMTRTRLKTMMHAFKEAGGDAMEVQTSRTDKNQTYSFCKLCEELDLCGSQGSDFHHLNKPWIRPGDFETMPDFIEPVWALFNPPL